MSDIRRVQIYLGLSALLSSSLAVIAIGLDSSTAWFFGFKGHVWPLFTLPAISVVTSVAWATYFAKGQFGPMAGAKTAFCTFLTICLLLAANQGSLLGTPVRFLWALFWGFTIFGWPTVLLGAYAGRLVWVGVKRSNQLLKPTVPPPIRSGGQAD